MTHFPGVVAVMFFGERKRVLEIDAATTTANRATEINKAQTGLDIAKRTGNGK